MEMEMWLRVEGADSRQRESEAPARKRMEKDNDLTWQVIAGFETFTWLESLENGCSCPFGGGASFMEQAPKLSASLHSKLF
jgi:hypothetical protein